MTVTTAISITGLDDVLRQIREIRAEALRPVVEDVLDWIAGDAADYPPPRGYVRSGRLGRGWLEGDWDVRDAGDSLFASLTNGVPYAGEVMGPDGQQRATHAGYWRTTDDLVDAWEPRVARAIEDALETLVS